MRWLWRFHPPLWLRLCSPGLLSSKEASQLCIPTGSFLVYMIVVFPVWPSHAAHVHCLFTHLFILHLFSTYLFYAFLHFGYNVRLCAWKRWRKWQPTPVPLPRKSHGQRNPADYTPWGRKRVRCDLATKQQQQHIHNRYYMKCKVKVSARFFSCS